ncbi:uncharacterized protein LOC124306100 isoform X1 [Neodiprion virginianus]|uniref:uncharacterized protein LOC124306100 isoform X1 n=2 Tax=Neodiprion virginianus TaxID=2961670 RepID=UPI001EE6BF63|nr:uncharacterized protein LOC124306100 isoform X1 [Neodiprion virginianus]
MPREILFPTFRYRNLVVGAAMSLERELDAIPSSFSSDVKSLTESSAMLNLRKLPDAGVQNGGGRAGILSIASVEISEETASTRVVEKFDKQTKKVANLPGSGETVDSHGVKLGLTEGATGPTESGSSGESLEACGKELRIISLDEIAWHDTPDDCWFAIYDYVYDCTSFIGDHPGGDDVLLEYAGRDATLAFIGAGHSKFARKSLERYLIGELPHSERIFRIADGVKVFGY